jgi:hypothetical protein
MTEADRLSISIRRAADAYANRPAMLSVREAKLRVQCICTSEQLERKSDEDLESLAYEMVRLTLDGKIREKPRARTR